MELLKRILGKKEEISEQPKMNRMEAIDRAVLWFFTDVDAVSTFGPDGRRRVLDKSQIVYEFPRVTVSFKEQEIIEKGDLSS